MTTFPHLFAPLTIRGVTLKNRIMSTGHDTTLPSDGTVNAALIAYHTARAKGGAGLIVTQVAGVHETARYTSHLLMAFPVGTSGEEVRAKGIALHHAVGRDDRGARRGSAAQRCTRDRRDAERQHRTTKQGRDQSHRARRGR